MVVETGNHVFTLAAGALSGYDKDAGTHTSSTTSNLLSDTDITGIYRDSASDMLLLAYENGNIDLISDKTGHLSVANIPDIAHASLTGSRHINDVAFAGDTIWLATDFGLVALSASRRETIASGRYGAPVSAVTATPTHVIMQHDGSLYSIPRESRINSISGFTKMATWGPLSELSVTSGGILLLRNAVGSDCLKTARIAPQADALSDIRSIGPGLRTCKPLIHCRDATLAVADGRLYSIAPDGASTIAATLPSELHTDAVTTLSGADALWCASPAGIACYGYVGGQWTVLADRYRPEALSVARPAYLIPSSDGSRIYVTNLGPTNYRLGQPTGNDAVNQLQATSVIDARSGEIADVTAYPAPAAFSITAGQQASLGQYPMATARLAEDPDTPDIYWLCTGNDGLYRIASGRLDCRFDLANSPLPAAWGVRTFEVAFDPQGNLWVTAQGTSDNTGIAILPADKRLLPTSAIRKSDWRSVSIPGFTANKDMRMLICHDSDMILLTDATPGTILTAIDTRGTYSDPSDDIVRSWTSFTDQDGKTFAPSRHTSLALDRNGHVWLGTDMGIAEIADPRDAINPNMTVSRIKVPRNDGTNTADYICESDLVYDIAVDHANRKWIATDASGVCLVSPDGSEIIARFTPDNSPLPSARVNAVYACALSNTVYFATDRGLVAYGAEASPPAETYDDILVYPNPVRPGYSGSVTITGLLDGSLVKIADVSGHTLWQGRSEGGMARWDLSTSSGRRVRSGVYYILVSRSGADISTAGAVSKITVIN